MLDKWLSRRTFLLLPVLVPLAARASALDSTGHTFQYDHVLGTSLDLAVWTSDAAAAQRINDVVMQEVDRLTSILNTRDAASEIQRMDLNGTLVSQDLSNVLAEYDLWKQRTAGILSIHPSGPGSPRNVDALGKAYILDQAARSARRAGPDVEGVLLNIGGDIVTWGRAVELSIADPSSPYDNGRPLTRLVVQDCAIATSGSYARGAHLLDARSGRPALQGAAATVIAPNAVTANALATTMCIAGDEAGFSLLKTIPNAEALYVESGRERRSPGFRTIERPMVQRISMVASWPAGYQLTLSLTLTDGRSNSRFGGRGGRGGRGGQRPYVAVWIENSAGKIIRILAFWASKERYFSELSRFWATAGRDRNLVYSVARATRSPGKYDLQWDGFDDKHSPVPTGTYRVIVETNQEHGVYAKQESTIECGATPSTMTLSATTNFEAVAVQYGPRAQQA